MRSKATVLMLDDGELNALGLLLFELGVDLTWKTGAEIAAPLARPRDLLITNRRRALEVPHLIPDMRRPGGPVWICAHPKDFSSLREFLRELGAHFLLQFGPNGPDPQLIRALVSQLVHSSGERRQKLRFPCACEVSCLANGERFSGQLLDLSEDSCRLQSNRDLPVSTPISIYLPVELDPAAPNAYPGVVLRTSLRDRDQHLFDLVLGFEDAQVQSALARIIAGQGRGTRILKLNPLPARGRPGEEIEISIDRREVTRHRYRQRVACLLSLEDDNPLVIMAQDLSMTGIRVASHPQLTPDRRVYVALPQGKGVSPLLLEGTVQSDTDYEGIGIEFSPLDRDRSEILRRMLEKLSPLQPHVDELGHADITLLSGDPDLERGK